MKLASTTAAILAPRILDALHTAPKTPERGWAIEHLATLVQTIADLEEMYNDLIAEQRAKDEGD